MKVTKLFSPDVAEGGTASGGVDSSTTAQTDVQPADSSPAAKDVKDKTPVSFEEAAIAETLKRHPAKGQNDKASDSSSTETSTEAEASESGGIQELNATEDKENSHVQDTEDGQAKDTESSKTEDGKTKNKSKVEKPDDFSDVPFHKHERFKSLLKDRNELRETTAKLEPVVKRMTMIDSYCQQHGITPAQFKDAIEITALINTNPLEARKRLNPMLEHLGRFQGDVLPADLKAEVDAGTLSIERAKQIVSLDMQAKHKQQLAERTAQTNATDQVFNTLQAWEANAHKTDPDYSKKSKLVEQVFTAKSNSVQVLTPALAKQFAEEAYAEVNATISGFAPKQQPVKALNGATSTPQNGQLKEPTSWDKVDDYVVAKFAARRK
jgi:hypothetical protein